MRSYIEQFWIKIKSSVSGEITTTDSDREIDSLIALGVLIWIVSEADGQFLPEEKDKMIEVLRDYEDVSEARVPVILNVIEEAAKQRIDLHSFTHEVSVDLARDRKIMIIEQLFRVACIDNDLSNAEYEMIRKINHLFRLDHSDFIAAKVRVKKEFGMDTAGL